MLHSDAEPLFLEYFNNILPRGISNGTFGKWGDNREKVHLEMGQFCCKFMVLKVPSCKFSLDARIEGAVITIMYHLHTFIATK